MVVKKKEKDNFEVVRLNLKGEFVKLKKLKLVKLVVFVKSMLGVLVLWKRIEDGFVVYSEEELGFNRKNVGGFVLCFFDCDCCF